MNVKEILKLYRQEKIESMVKHNMLDAETLEKVKIIDEIFENTERANYRGCKVPIVRMFYRDRLSMSECANTVHVCERQAYRIRDDCVNWLSDMLDNPPS